MSKVDDAAHYLKVATTLHPAVVEVKTVGENVIAVVDFRGRDATLLQQINQIVDVFPERFPGVGFGVEPVGEAYTVDHMRGRATVPTIVVPTIVK